EIVLMRAGRIVAQGTPDAMLEPRHLQAAFGVTMLKTSHPLTGAPMCVPAYEGVLDADPAATGVGEGEDARASEGDARGEAGASAARRAGARAQRDLAA